MLNHYTAVYTSCRKKPTKIRYSQYWSKQVTVILASISCIDRVQVISNVFNYVMSHIVNVIRSQKLHARHSTSGINMEPLKNMHRIQLRTNLH